MGEVTPPSAPATEAAANEPYAWVCNLCGQLLPQGTECNSGYHVGPSGETKGIPIRSDALVSLVAATEQQLDALLARCETAEAELGETKRARDVWRSIADERTNAHVAACQENSRLTRERDEALEDSHQLHHRAEEATAALAAERRDLWCCTPEDKAAADEVFARWESRALTAEERLRRADVMLGTGAWVMAEQLDSVRAQLAATEQQRDEALAGVRELPNPSNVIKVLTVERDTARALRSLAAERVLELEAERDTAIECMHIADEKQCADFHRAEAAERRAAETKAERDALRTALVAFETIAINGTVCTPPDTWSDPMMGGDGTGTWVDIDAMKCPECKGAWEKLRAALSAGGPERTTT